jgi:hypothetical protein
MPYTAEDIVDMVNRLLTYEINPDDLHRVIWSDGSVCTDLERRDILALYVYTVSTRRERDTRAQRAASRLLRSLLNSTQRRSLRQSGYFYVTVQGGSTYRLLPRIGRTERVARHGCRWFAKQWFCLHDADEGRMPPADLIVAHLLLLVTDEAEFLRLANVTNVDSSLWDGSWLRRVRQARRDRESA